MDTARHLDPAFASVSPVRPAPGCPVCRSSDVLHDEVFDPACDPAFAGATLQLAECRHCEHRWTARTHPGQSVARSFAVPARRVAARSTAGGAAAEGGVASAA